MIAKQPALVRIKEAAARLGVSRGTVYNLIAAGDLDAVNVAPTGSKQAIHVIPEDSLNALIASRRTNARRLRSA